MTIAMYGMGPIYPGGRFPEWPAPSTSPTPSVLPGTATVVGPMVPETTKQIRKRLESRVAWLENELRMHASWTEELKTLRRMLAAMTPTEPERTDR